MAIKVCAVSSTRADYGIFSPLLKKMASDEAFHLTVVATGTHLLPLYGHTVDEIVRDGFQPVSIPILLSEKNDAVAVSDAMGEALRQFSRFFSLQNFDILLVLGDRYEIEAVCCASVNCRLPIAHIHGGETTEGAIDECYRHAITKMSWLHFAAAEAYRRRIIQLGEDPARVFNVGALAVENIQSEADYPLTVLSKELGLPLLKGKYAVVTYHPVTQESNSEKEQMQALMAAMDERCELSYIVTKANADEGGSVINTMWDLYGEGRTNCRIVKSLGMSRYLSALKNSAMVLGNSSSGILEAPVCGVPTVNIGDRQAGRLRASSVIDCASTKEAILEAMAQAQKMQLDGMTADYLFGKGDTSGRIIAILKEQWQKPVCLKKTFWNLPTQVQNEF